MTPGTGATGTGPHGATAVPPIHVPGQQAGVLGQLNAAPPMQPASHGARLRRNALPGGTRHTAADNALLRMNLQVGQASSMLPRASPTVNALDLASPPRAQAVRNVAASILHGSAPGSIANADATSSAHGSMDTIRAGNPQGSLPTARASQSTPRPTAHHPLEPDAGPDANATEGETPLRPTTPPPMAAPSVRSTEGSSTHENQDTESVIDADVAGILSRLGHFVQDVRENKFDNHAAGWAANVVNAASRDGVTVFAVDVIREVVGDLVEHHMANMRPETKTAIGASILLSAMILNGAAVLREHFNGTETTNSKSARAFNIAALVTTLGAAWGTNTLASGAAGLVKGNVGAMLRDIGNLFHGLDDNLSTNLPEDHPSNATTFGEEAPPVPTHHVANTVNGAVYLGQQTVFGGAVMSPAGSGTSGIVQALPLSEGAKHITNFAGGGAASEVVDALTMSMFNAFFNNADASVAGVKNGLSAVMKMRLSAEFQLPSIPSFADKITGTYTSRASMVSVVYGLSSLLGIDPKDLSKDDVNWLQNFMTSLPEFALYPAFMAGLDKKPKPSSSPV